MTKRSIQISLLCVCLCLLGACVSLLGPREMRVSSAQLHTVLAKKFPVSKNYLDMLEVTIQAPQLTLLPSTTQQPSHSGNASINAGILSQGRIRARFPLTLKSPLLGSRAVAAWAQLSGALRFDIAQNAVFLDHVILETLQLEGNAQRFSNAVSSVFNGASFEMLQTAPLYQLRDEDLKFAGQSFTPRAIVVEENTLMLRLMPVSK